MISFKTFLVEIYPPDNEIRRKISFRISQKGVPEKVAIAQGWSEYKLKRPDVAATRDKINNPYYRKKQGLDTNEL